MRLPVKTCTECGGEFVPLHARRITCSDICRARRLRRLLALRRPRTSALVVMTSCEECGETFARHRHRGRPRVTCGTLCDTARRKRLRREDFVRYGAWA